MRSKNIAAGLALITGVFGLHRFYLGQVLKGAIYLLSPAIVTVLLAVLIGNTEILKDFQTDFGVPLLNYLFFAPWPLYAIVLLVAIIDAVVLVTMSYEKFDRKFNAAKETITNQWLKSLVILFLGIMALILIYNRFFTDHTIRTASSKAELELTADQLCAKISENAETKAGLNDKTIQLTGTIVGDEFNISDDSRTLILLDNDDCVVQCKFKQAVQEEVKSLEKGTLITVIGLCKTETDFDWQVELIDCDLSVSNP
jgi:TM2 domain-containing membrane protein YozV